MGIHDWVLALVLKIRQSGNARAVLQDVRCQGPSQSPYLFVPDALELEVLMASNVSATIPPNMRRF